MMVSRWALAAACVILAGTASAQTMPIPDGDARAAPAAGAPPPRVGLAEVLERKDNMIGAHASSLKPKLTLRGPQLAAWTTMMQAFAPLTPQAGEFLQEYCAEMPAREDRATPKLVAARSRKASELLLKRSAILDGIAGKVDAFRATLDETQVAVFDAESGPLLNEAVKIPFGASDTGVPFTCMIVGKGPEPLPLPASSSVPPQLKR